MQHEEQAATSELSVSELWRYPVKSMAGERLAEARLTEGGIDFDRGWAVRDERAQTIRGAKYMPTLMRCSARYLQGTDAGLVPHVEIYFPNGDTMVSDDPRIHDRLSEVVDRKVTLWPLQPAENLDFYRVGKLDTGDILSEFRKMFGLLDDEPLPDFNLPPEEMRKLAEFAAPPGTFFDGFAFNILAEASIRDLQARLPDSQLPVTRFRPNLLVGDRGKLVEQLDRKWIGKTLKIGGGVTVEVTMKCPRCVMVSHPHDDVPKDTSITRTLVREFDYSLSVYADCIASGTIREGDPIEVIEREES